MEMKMKIDLDAMRDCVKQALLNGCQRGHEFKKMRHAIILELKRLGYDSLEIRDKLLEWNKRCEKPLGIGEQRSQLLKYVDWVDKNECKMGCNALKDYCLGKERCQFHKRTTRWKREQTQKPPFDINELDNFLRERFKADGHIMLLIVKALRFYQQEKATGEMMLIGLRGIGSIIRDRCGHMIHFVDVGRKIGLLIDEGVIEKVVQGKSGMFRGKANGYRFLPWRPPQAKDAHIPSDDACFQEKYEGEAKAPIITYMCNKGRRYTYE